MQAYPHNITSSRYLVLCMALYVCLWEHGVPGQVRDLIDHQLEIIRDEGLNLLHRVLDTSTRCHVNFEEYWKWNMLAM